MPLIEHVIGRRVWDSRGWPAVEAEVVARNGVTGRAIAPSASSSHPAGMRELRDGGAAFEGLGVTRAVAGIAGDIAQALTGLDVRDQDTIDRRLIALDGTPDKSRLGANAILAVSMAVAEAGAKAADLALWEYLARGKLPGCFPSPVVDLFSGGDAGTEHGGPDFNSIRLAPVEAPDFATGLEWARETMRAATMLLKGADSAVGLSEMGGLAVRFETADEALALGVRAIERAGLQPGEDLALILDIGANRFGRGGRYLIAREAVTLPTGQMIQRALGLLRRYPITGLIDPLAQDDLAGVVHLTEAAGSNVSIIGGDVLISNTARIAAAAKIAAFNAVELRLTDCGTLTELRESVAAARTAGFEVGLRAEAGFGTSGALAHVALGLGAGTLAPGGLARGERIAVWNEALRLAGQPAS